MKTISILALILALVSCATPPPRAIIPPKSEIAQIDVAPVSKAADKTRAAVREVADAGNVSREASRKLSDTSILLRAAIDRAEMLSKDKGDLEADFSEIQRFATNLSADVVNLRSALETAEHKEAAAVSASEKLANEVFSLRESTAAQTVQIKQSKATEATLREQVELLSALPDKLAKAKQKADTLEWWTWRLGILSVALTVIIIGLAYLLLKP